jgi:hypothetical protein
MHLFLGRGEDCGNRDGGCKLRRLGCPQQQVLEILLAVLQLETHDRSVLGTARLHP